MALQKEQRLWFSLCFVRCLVWSFGEDSSVKLDVQHEQCHVPWISFTLLSGCLVCAKLKNHWNRCIDPILHFLPLLSFSLLTSAGRICIEIALNQVCSVWRWTNFNTPLVYCRCSFFFLLSFASLLRLLFLCCSLREIGARVNIEWRWLMSLLHSVVIVPGCHFMNILIKCILQSLCFLGPLSACNAIDFR